MAASIERLIRCICGCSEFSLDEVKAMATANSSDFVGSAKVRTSVKTYLTETETGKVDVVGLIDCYEALENVIQRAQQPDTSFETLRDENYYSTITELDTYDDILEIISEIPNMITKEEILNALDEAARKLATEIFGDPYITRYIEEMLKKVKRFEKTKTKSETKSNE